MDANQDAYGGLLNQVETLPHTGMALSAWIVFGVALIIMGAWLWLNVSSKKGS